MNNIIPSLPSGQDNMQNGRQKSLCVHHLCYILRWVCGRSEWPNRCTSRVWLMAPHQAAHHGGTIATLHRTSAPLLCTFLVKSLDLRKSGDDF